MGKYGNKTPYPSNPTKAGGGEAGFATDLHHEMVSTQNKILPTSTKWTANCQPSVESTGGEEKRRRGESVSTDSQKTPINPLNRTHASARQICLEAHDVSRNRGSLAFTRTLSLDFIWVVGTISISRSSCGEGGRQYQVHGQQHLWQS